MSTPFPDPMAADAAALLDEVEALRSEAREQEREHEADLAALHPAFAASGRNLVHYLALRRHDLRPLQDRLARLGLSSLGRSEAHVLETLNRVAALLRLLSEAPASAVEDEGSIGFDEGALRLAAHTAALLGPIPSGRPVRIMVTLPSEAAKDYALVRDLLRQGMDAARINCAHDDDDAWDAMLRHLRRAGEDVGRPCRVLMDLAGPKLRTGELVAEFKKGLVLQPGDDLVLTHDPEPGGPTDVVEDGTIRTPAHVACTLPEIFRAVRPGQPVWFDDGKIGGVARSTSPDALVVRITHAKPGGSRLKGSRGINLPETALDLPALTEKDRADLAFAARRADLVGLSFVNGPEDVAALQEALAALGVPKRGIVLKIETRRGFDRLPRILLRAMRSFPVGVMIARGDLAVECGFERLAEVQEEILWLCEAAHVPAIWATQVLEGLAKKGFPTRAEVTDAAMSVRAECVMLNKGPYILEAIATLDDILRRMRHHQAKKQSMLRRLHVSQNL